MADTTITIPDLGSLTSGQASDLLLATRGTTGYKMLLSDLAKYMVETYNSSSLAGSAQSVKNALDSLNSSLDIIKFINKTTQPNVAFTFTLSSGYRGWLIAIDSYSNRCGMYFVYSNSSGGITTIPILAASNITINMPTNNALTITSSGNTRLTLMTTLGTATVT